MKNNYTVTVDLTNASNTKLADYEYIFSDNSFFKINTKHSILAPLNIKFQMENVEGKKFTREVEIGKVIDSNLDLTNNTLTLTIKPTEEYSNRDNLSSEKFEEFKDLITDIESYLSSNEISSKVLVHGAKTNNGIFKFFTPRMYFNIKIMKDNKAENAVSNEFSDRLYTIISK